MLARTRFFSARTLLAGMLLSLALLALPGATESHARQRGLDRVERQIVNSVNAIRSAHGLPRLRHNRALSRSADYHCRDMLRADFFAHASSNGMPFDQRVNAFRPSQRIGETLAYLPREAAAGAAQRVVDMWMASPPHRASLLSPIFQRIGLARRQGKLGGGRVFVYTADLASRR